MGKVEALIDINFEDCVLKGPIPVLVHFSATWSGPCRTIAPIIADLAKDYEDKINVYTMDIDENPTTFNRYAGRGVPTLMLFKEGECVRTFVGLVSRTTLASSIDSELTG
jgi:thioredoxin 1